MTRPTRYLVRMGLFLTIILGLALVLHDVIIKAFMANPGLDGTIIAVLILGIIWNIHLTERLFPEVRWIELLRQQREGLQIPAPPKLLAPMARLLTTARHQDHRHLAFSSQTSSTMLESLGARMDEGREISRYITQLLVFLGLLGTFYGLILTVSSVVDVINNMPSGGSDLSLMFDHVKTGLAKPLNGMSTAFSASMFGLAGSLILGFLDLTTGQAQNRFFNEIEEWLADITFLDSPKTEPATQQHTHGTSFSGSVDSWLPRVQDFMRLTTENVSLLQQNISMLRTSMEEAEESRHQLLSSLHDINRTLRQQRHDDPATTQLLQQIERQMAGLRDDIRSSRSLTRKE